MSVVTRRLIIAVLVLAWAPLASAQTVDEVIEKHLTAMGGRAALAKVKSRSMTGTIALSTPVGELSGPVEVMNQAPNKSRTLIKLDLSAVGAGEMTVDQRFDGTVGFVSDSMQGNRDVTGNQLENMKNATFPSPFLDYKERGVTVELGAKEQVGGKDAYLLTIKAKSGSVVRQWVDAETYLPLRVALKVEIPQIGEVEQTTEFADFRDVDGVKVPFTIKSSSAAQSFTITVTKVEHNTKIDETLFVKPGDR
ncbi:MAG: outer membrane lipoprotein-sorting protein [Acidobacteriota bacterium]|nr:outer membrane lipoprotein-sorting protein [Acidobacteriota bacterium]